MVEGRAVLQLPLQVAHPRPAAPVAEYARAYMLRLARLRAGRAAQRRADLRAKAFELVAADRLNGRA